MVRVDGELLGGYHRDVHELTRNYLDGITVEELDRVVDTRWDPPVTAAVRLVSVIGDALQHLGQAAYVRGLAERRASAWHQSSQRSDSAAGDRLIWRAARHARRSGVPLLWRSMTQHRFYGDLAPWWPLISAPEEYAEEAAFAASLLRTADRPDEDRPRARQRWRQQRLPPEV